MRCADTALHVGKDLAVSPSLSPERLIQPYFLDSTSCTEDRCKFQKVGLDIVFFSETDVSVRTSSSPTFLDMSAFADSLITESKKVGLETGVTP